MHKIILRIVFGAGGVFCLNKTTITVGSVTYAIKVRKLLSRMNVQSKLVKVDASKTVGGCTHGLEFASADYYSVVMELKKAGIKYTVYRD